MSLFTHNAHLVKGIGLGGDGMVGAQRHLATSLML
jgi:hypothetical protein